MPNLPLIRLAQYGARAKQINARELLYGQEQTDYASLARMGKAFEPYAFLWLGMDDWRRWQVEWRTGDFSGLNPEQMERDINDTWRNLFKASKALAEFESISKMALAVRAEIDAFKPVMPLVTALRNPGLRPRHWDNLSSELGFEIKPGTSLKTLDDVERLQLQTYEDKVIKSCEGAGKEYGIESALDKMQVRKEGLLLQLLCLKTYY